MNNEEYIKAIEMRASRRSYKSVPLDEGTKANIKSMIDYVNKQILALYLLKMLHLLSVFFQAGFLP